MVHIPKFDTSKHEYLITVPNGKSEKLAVTTKWFGQRLVDWIRYKLGCETSTPLRQVVDFVSKQYEKNKMRGFPVIDGEGASELKNKLTKYCDNHQDSSSLKTEIEKVLKIITSTESEKKQVLKSEKKETKEVLKPISNESSALLKFKMKPEEKRVNQEFFKQAMSDLKSDRCAVKELNFDSCSITDENFEQLLDALQVNQSLEFLNLNGLKIREEELGGKAIAALCEAIKQHPSIRQVSFNHIPLKGEGARVLAHFLKNDTKIQALSLQYADLQSDDAAVICEALKKNTTLRSLDLYWNYLYAKGAEHIADLLEYNQTLEVLNLGANNIKTKTKHLFSSDETLSGVQALTNILKTHPSLHTLDVRRNYLGDEGGTLFAKMLEENTNLKSFDISWNQLKEGTSQALKQTFIKNKTLEHVSVFWNEFTNLESIQNIAEGLKGNRSIRTFDIAGNSIDREKPASNGESEKTDEFKVLQEVVEDNDFPRTIRYSGSEPIIALGVASLMFSPLIGIPFVAYNWDQFSGKITNIQ